MTTAEIIAYCEERGVTFSIRFMPNLGHARWSARVGDVENMRTGDALDTVVQRAWAAYTREVA